MKSNINRIVWISLLILLAACSQNQSSSDSSSMADSETISSEQKVTDSSTSPINSDEKQPPDEAVNDKPLQDALLIQKAHVQLNTEDYDLFYRTLQTKLEKYNAHITQIEMHKSAKGDRSGNLTLRVPKENFQPLIDGVSQYSEVTSKEVSANDVTTEYVDLNSRLKAKEKIESRLLDFMDGAEKTEDLIQISQDLERVQEEIEVIKGKIKYFKNQADYSTITFAIKETNVIVPKIENDHFNTWKKIKQAFASSINHLTHFLSGLAVFILGYSPFLLLVAAVVFAGWLLYSRRSRRQQ